MHRVVSIVPVPAQVLYDVACDLTRYRRFVPWCRGVEAMTTAKDGILTARMDIAFGPFRESFISDVRMDEAALRVEARLNDAESSLQHLLSVWHFTPLEGNRARAELSLDWRFKSFARNLASQAAAGLITARAQAAFEREALAVYHAGLAANVAS